MLGALLAYAASTSNCAIDQGGSESGPPERWAGAHGPVVPHDTFPTDCSLCHVGAGWHQIRGDFAFDHGRETGLPLHGAHERAECLRCHNDRGPVQRYAARGCAGCHEDPHQGRLGRDCLVCHEERDWEPRAQDERHARSRFPLIGAHSGVACFRCHPGAEVGNFQRADTRCESCHQDDLARATSPNHIAQGWIRDCQRCHAPTAWTGASFNHSIFPLTGAHTSAACTACHGNGVYRGTPRDCASCHIAEYNATTDPNHVTAGFPTSCEQCHNTSAWEGARFGHTTFPLTGAHAAVTCSACHQNGVYRGTPQNCASCHIARYNATTNPNHATAGFPTSCEQCHGTSTWQGAVFNHPFPIQGPHNVACAVCHTVPGNSKVFTCIVCHEHNQTEMNQKHSQVSGYSYNSNACYTCHPNGRH